MIPQIDRQRAEEINRGGGKWIAVEDGGKYRIAPRPRGQRNFNAAMVNRLTGDWTTTQRSSDDVLRYQLERLIARSRDLERNNEYANGFFLQAERNVIGENGIMLNMQVREPDLRGGFKVDTAAGDAIERAWREFGKAKNFLISGDLTQVEVQQLVLRSVMRDGASVGRFIRGREAGNKFGLSLQLLEIDHLDTDYNARYGPTGNAIKMGVEMDGFGRVVAYHMLTDHPGDSSYVYRMGRKKYMRVPAQDIVHPFRRFRIGQSRGYPWLASTMSGLQMLLGYKEAELVASRHAASIGNFLRDPEGVGNPYEDESEEEGCDPQSVVPMEPGMNQYIGNLEVVPHNPAHPVQAFGDFVSETLRGVAVGMGISHHNLSGNMNGVNYSSARIAELAERDQWKLLQTWFAEAWLRPIFDEFLEMALVMGEIRLPNGTPLPLAKIEKFNQPVWRGRRWQWVDPLKEVNAAEKALANSLTSHRKIISENGMDEEDLYAEIARGKELREQMGLTGGEMESNPVDKEDIENANQDT